MAGRLSNDRLVAAAIAFGAVPGHAYPCWKWGGAGYGASPMFGGLAVLDPIGLLATNGLVFAMVRLTGDGRFVMVWPVTLPPWGAVAPRARTPGLRAGRPRRHGKPSHP